MLLFLNSLSACDKEMLFLLHCTLSVNILCDKPRVGSGFSQSRVMHDLTTSMCVGAATLNARFAVSVRVCFTSVVSGSTFSLGVHSYG